MPLENRLWAGGRVSFLAPLLLGATIDKRSTVAGVEHKVERSGDLVFVTVRHELFHEGTLALTEEHDIVYRDPSLDGSGAPPRTRPPGTSQKPFVPDTTMLFRYSALTFNGHRIHYDADYCRNVEGYDELVIHGPLSATMLAGFAEEVSGKVLQSFAYRGLRPALLGHTLILNATIEDGEIELWTALPDGSISMQAEARLG